MLITCSNQTKKAWWRRRELNPRPKKPDVQRLRVYPILFFKQLSKEPAKARVAEPD